MTVANHYIKLRNVPPDNVFFVDYPTNKAWMRSDAFRDKILRPAMKAITERHLSRQIDYVVYSCDFPYQVHLDRDFPDQNFPISFKPSASLTGATYLAAFVDGKRKEILSPVTNLYASASTKRGPTISRAFRANYNWAVGGNRVAKGRGIGYLLSAMLGVTYGRGNTTQEIIYYLGRSVEADETQPKGTVYFVKNSTPRSTPRHDQFPAAVRELRLAGVEAEISEGKFLQFKRNIIGVTCGHYQLGLAQSKCRFLPGALCDNLTSAGGIFYVPKKKPGQTCISEFLRMGAAGACGTVIEPTAMAEKFPMPTMHVHYARGCSLAESFYQSVLCPYQQLLVGDPLCQPWATIPTIVVDGVKDKDFIRGTISLTPTAKDNTAEAVGKFEFYVDGVQTAVCRAGETFSLDTTSLADGYHELRVVGIDSTPIETRGRWIARVTVKNGREAIQLSCDPASLRPAIESITVSLAATAGGPVVVMHNGREVARHSKGSGEVQIVTSKLGKGPITLYANSIGKVKVRSQPLRFVIP